MSTHPTIKFKIDPTIIENYVKSINAIKIPMKQLKEQLNQVLKTTQPLQDTIISVNKPTEHLKSTNISDTMNALTEQFKNINKINEIINDQIKSFPNEKLKIYTDTIQQIIDANNGMISTRMIEPLNINRSYLSIMENNNIIEKSSRGIYLSPDAFEDTYFTFQQKYKKAVFSHMNALYFYGMTEEFPYNYTVTVPQRYHVDTVNEKCVVFYVSDDIYQLGITETKTPSGNIIRAYDKERCICDIIRSKNRMDIEQVKKSIREYNQSKDKNLYKLSEYANKMGISKKVMEIVGEFFYERLL